MRTRKVISLLLATLCLAVAMSCLFVACDKADGDDGGAKAFVCVDINPSVELITDASGTVLGISGVNTDARVMLYNEGGLVGVPLNIALDNLISLAASCGYLGGDMKNIGISVTSDSQEITFDSVKQQLVASTAKCGATVEIVNSDDCDVVLKTELDMLKSENGAYADISVAKYRLMKLAESVAPFEQTRYMNATELIAHVQTAWTETTETLDTSMTRATAEAQFAYESARLFARDSLYVSYFWDKAENAENILQVMQYRTRTLYASRYVALHSAYEYLKHCREVVDDYASDPLLDDDTLREIYALLAPFITIDLDTFCASLQCAVSGVTAKNLNAFVNGLYRNADEQTKAQIANAYRTLKSEILDGLDFMSAIGETDESFDKILNATLSLISPDENDLQTHSPWVTVDASLFSFVNTDDIERLDASIQVLKEMTDAAYDDIGLTGEELNEINALSETVSDKITEAQEECADTIEALTLSAESWFESKKNSLTGASN